MRGVDARMEGGMGIMRRGRDSMAEKSEELEGDI